jgi:hypothetical protein
MAAFDEAARHGDTEFRTRLLLLEEFIANFERMKKFNYRGVKCLIDTRYERNGAFMYIQAELFLRGIGRSMCCIVNGDNRCSFWMGDLKR